MKKLFAILLIAVICFGFPACGGETIEYTETPDIIENMVKSSDDTTDCTAFFGIWEAVSAGDYDYVEIYPTDSETRFEIRRNEYVEASGYLQYESEHGFVYAFNEHDGYGYRCFFDDIGRLNIAHYGSFKLNNDLNIYTAVQEDFELFGSWYYDGTAASDRIIEIDADGNWIMNESIGSQGAYKMVDYGVIKRSDWDNEIYLASSSVYGGTTYRVYRENSNTVYWGDGNECFRRTD